MSRIETTTGTITKNFSSYDTTDYSCNSISNVSNAYTSISSSNRCQIGLTQGSSASTYIKFKFNTASDIGSLPSGAYLTSVSCKTKTGISNTGASNVASRGCRLYLGETAVGSTGNLTTTVAIRTLLSNVGSLTLSDFTDAKVRFYATRGTANTTTNYIINVYGGELILGYAYDTTYYSISASSTIPGISVSVGSDEVISGDNTSVTFVGSIPSEAIILDNGIDVTSSAIISNNYATLALTNIGSDHVITLTLPPTGPTVFLKQNGSWVQAESVFYKQNGVWVQVESMGIKDNGSWIT